MKFASPPIAYRMPGVVPLIGVSLLPALLVLTMACLSMNRAEETVRLPVGALPRPPFRREVPIISLRMSRSDRVSVDGELIAQGGLPAAWQREAAAVRLLGFEPPQANVVLRADPDLPTEKVQKLLETAQEAGFTRCVLRSLRNQ